MKKYLVNLSKDLIRFDTTPENINSLDSCMDYITSQFEGYAVDVKRYYTKERPSLLINFSNQKVTKLILNGHIDVVPGKPEQFEPKIKGNKLYGRGAADMKGAVAVFIKLMQDLSKQKKPPKVGLMLVADEEIGHSHSTNNLLDRKVMCEFGICGEPTQLKIGTKAKGVSTYDILVSGKSSHASRPWEGQNAVLKTFYNYRKIQKYFDNKKGWHCTLNLTMIQGGNAINATPEECRVVLDVRYTKMDEITKIDNIVQKAFGIGLNKLLDFPILNTPRNNAYVKLLRDSYKTAFSKDVKFISQYGSSDAVAFAKKAIPAIEFGPKGNNWHGSNEYVKIDSLINYYIVLKKFVENI